MVKILYHRRDMEQPLAWCGELEKLGGLIGSGGWVPPALGSYYDPTSPRFQEGYSQMRGWVNDPNALRLVLDNPIVLEV
jgi:hypothetical protein